MAYRQISVETKVRAVKRVLRGEITSAVAHDMEVDRNSLGSWKKTVLEALQTRLSKRARPTRDKNSQTGQRHDWQKQLNNTKFPCGCRLRVRNTQNGKKVVSLLQCSLHESAARLLAELKHAQHKAQWDLDFTHADKYAMQQAIEMTENN